MGKNSHSPYIEGDYAIQRAQAGAQVILLGTAWCGYCAKTRAYLKSRGVAFADLDIEQSKLAEQLHEAPGGEGVPVILIGNRQIRGYRPKVIDEAIALLGISAKPDPVL
jgi:mycoredoxin